MFVSKYAKQLSQALKREGRDIFTEVHQSFENAVVGNTREVDFLRVLIKEMSARCGNMTIPGATITSRFAEIHQKPIVETPNYRCELGDLLVVVKYRLLDHTTESKSILYQVKLSDTTRTKYKIDQNQLDLLTNWPEFAFGRAIHGPKNKFRIAPNTAEFGSYLLAPRNPEKGQTLAWEADIPAVLGIGTGSLPPTYGVCPTALQCQALGPRSVKVDEKMLDVLADVDAFLSHLCFQIGESHTNVGVKNLISALYRYADLEPDPPHEFDDFSSEESRDVQFSVLELCVVQKFDQEASTGT